MGKHSQTPHPRQLTTEEERTIIIIRGKSHQGKTTLCQHLVSDQVGYLSFDSIVNNLGWCSIKDIRKFHKNLDHPSHMINRTNQYINDHHASPFIKSVFDKFILNHKHMYLVAEGHFFTLSNNFKIFSELCQRHHIRMWVSDRHL